MKYDIQLSDLSEISQIIAMTVGIENLLRLAETIPHCAIRTGPRNRSSFDKLAKIIGDDAAGKLISHFNGETLFIPTLAVAKSKARARAICKEWAAGDKPKDIATRHKLSRRAIYDIIRREPQPCPH